MLIPIKIWLLASLLVVACVAKEKSPGGSSQALDTTTKCEIEASGATLKTCFEYTKLPEEYFSVASRSCADEKGAFTSKAACSRTDNVGGCTQGAGATGNTVGQLVLYYYSPGVTEEQARRLCGENGQFVAP
jgi:hypothetical protein